MTAHPREITAKALVKADDGQMHWFEAVDHDDALWIATDWTATQYANMWQPGRLIRLESDRLMDMGRPPTDLTLHLYSLAGTIPKGALFDHSQPPTETHLTVLEWPDLFVRRRTTDSKAANQDS
jgi:hypothetical protein